MHNQSNQILSFLKYSFNHFSENNIFLGDLNIFDNTHGIKIIKQYFWDIFKCTTIGIFGFTSSIGNSRFINWFPNYNTRIDYMFCKFNNEKKSSISVKNFQIVDSKASDHKPIIAEIHF